jgi:hydrogenase maturation protease
MRLRRRRLNSSMRTLIGGIGYWYLRDGSLGPVVAAELARESWPAETSIEDLSYGPIAVIQRLQDVAVPFERLVLVAAVRRGRPAGTVSAFRWDGTLPDEEQVQARVAEAVTGVISLDNLLAVAGFFDALPPEVLVVEVEPEDEGWGEGFSESVDAVRSRVMQIVRELGVQGGSRLIPA